MSQDGELAATREVNVVLRHVESLRAVKSQVEEVTQGVTPWLDAMDAKKMLSLIDGSLSLIEMMGVALHKIAEDYDTEDTPGYVPLQRIGTELRRRQKIAQNALYPAPSAAKTKVHEHG